MFRTHNLSLITFALLFSLISGCSSSSDSNNNPSTGGSSVIGATLSGVAAKGIIYNGTVTAYELDASGNTLRTVGNATTDRQGLYELSLSSGYSGGPLVVIITNNSETEMKCDALQGCGIRTDSITDINNVIDYGEWYTPISLSMKAVIPVANSNEKISVNVTPFTHLAAQKVLESGNVTEVSVRTSNSKVSNLLGGIDILNTRPIDITESSKISSSSPTQISYAAFGAGIASLADTDTYGQLDVESTLNKLSDSVVDDSINADDDDVSTISLQEIVTATDAIFTAQGITDTSGVVLTLEQKISVARAGSGTVIIKASDTVGLSDMGRAKAMVADVRTWGDAYIHDMKMKQQLFDEKVAVAKKTIGQYDYTDSRDATVVIGWAISAGLSYLSNTITDINQYQSGLDWNNCTNSYSCAPFYPFKSGDISVSSNNNITTIKVSNAIHEWIAAHDNSSHFLTVNVTFSIPETGKSGNVLSLSLDIAELQYPYHTYNSNGTVALALNKDVIYDYESFGTTNPSFVPENIDSILFELDSSEKITHDISDLVDYYQNGIPLASDWVATALVNPVIIKGTFKIMIYHKYASIVDVDTREQRNVLIAIIPGLYQMRGVQQVVDSITDSVIDEVDVNLNISSNNIENYLPFSYSQGTKYSEVFGMPAVSWAYYDSDNDSIIDSFKLINHEGTSVDITPTKIIGEFSYTLNCKSSDWFGCPFFWWGTPNKGIIYAADIQQAVQNESVDSTGVISINEIMNTYYGEFRNIVSISDTTSVSYDLSVDGTIDPILTEPKIPFLSLYIKDHQNVNNWIHWIVSTQFRVAFDDLPDVDVTFTAERRSYTNTYVSFKVSYDEKNLTFHLEKEKTDGGITTYPSKPSVVITNQDGFVLKLIFDTVISSDLLETQVLNTSESKLLYNNVEYAFLSEFNGLLRIDYVDGTFEIF